MLKTLADFARTVRNFLGFATFIILALVALFLWLFSRGSFDPLIQNMTALGRNQFFWLVMAVLLMIFTIVMVLIVLSFVVARPKESAGTSHQITVIVHRAGDETAGIEDAAVVLSIPPEPETRRSSSLGHAIFFYSTALDGREFKVNARKAGYADRMPEVVKLAHEKQVFLALTPAPEEAVAVAPTSEPVQTAPQEPPPAAFRHRGKEYVFVPGGAFVMGTPPERAESLNELDSRDAFSAESPQGEIEVGSFYMARYPVTNAEYKEFVDATGRRVPYRNDEMSQPFNWDIDARSYPAGMADHPVVLVSWHDARAYCEWLGGRLPTEAEWEKAGRGTEGREWPWGNTWQDDRCNSRETGLGKTSAVGQFSPRGDSPYGIADMAGNVWEWCSSVFDPYPYRAEDERESATSRGKRILRGGTFGMPSEKVRCAFRNGAYPDEYGFSIGLRVAFSGPPENGVEPVG